MERCLAPQLHTVMVSQCLRETVFNNQKQQGAWFSGSWAKVQMPWIVLTRDLYGTLLLTVQSKLDSYKEDCSTALWIHVQPIYGWSHKANATREISLHWIYEFIPYWDRRWHILINDWWWILNAWIYPNLSCSPFLWWAAWLRTLSLGIKFGWNHIQQFKGILPFAWFQRLGVWISSLQWSFDVLQFYIWFGEQLVEGW